MPDPDPLPADFWAAVARDFPPLGAMLARAESPLPAAEALLGKVDASSYSLADWLAALAAFDGWLDRAGVAARPLESMLGYVECCTLALPATLTPPDLATLTLRMLDDYGFDATRPASAAEEG